ncbi:hypothetical protein M513_12349 [Trichuris suis]|uniref:Uncharacterized protein n=1 Tax=Trichuris suis TaxID=68888 RepID=A0A085LP72_9BILA|nr:hypothetical protein M513_12349 [Trichuris suis]
MHSMSKNGQYGHSCQDLIVSPQEASPCACFGCRAEEEFKRFSGATFNFLNHEYSVSQVDKSSMPIGGSTQRNGARRLRQEKL